MNTSILRIPASLDAHIQMAPDFDESLAPPLLLLEPEGKDEHIALYLDYLSPGIEENFRACLLAQAITPDGEEAPRISGDAYLACPDHLAMSILGNDQSYHEAMKVRQMFVDWVDSFPLEGGLTKGSVLLLVHEYIEELLEDAKQKAEAGVTEKMAASLGLDPSQIIVIHL